MITPYENNISFKGATRWFQKEIFIKRETFDNIKRTTKSHFVGSLPSEIIKDIIQISKNVEEKHNKIKEIMNAFADIATEFQKINSKNMEAEINSSWQDIKQKANKIKTIFQKIILKKTKKTVVKTINKGNINEQYFARMPEGEKVEKYRQIAEEKLNKIFKKTKLIKKKEEIKVLNLGDGAFGKVLLIEFPVRMNWEPKVLKFFDSAHYTDSFNINKHGYCAENNIMIYVNNAFKNPKNQVFKKGYFGSLENHFLVSEYIPSEQICDVNFTQDTLDYIERVLIKRGLEHSDLRFGNIIRNKIIDYGGLEVVTKKYEW